MKETKPMVTKTKLLRLLFKIQHRETLPLKVAAEVEAAAAEEELLKEDGQPEEAVCNSKK
jgi:hypothetical protein